MGVYTYMCMYVCVIALKVSCSLTSMDLVLCLFVYLFVFKTGISM